MEKKKKKKDVSSINKKENTYDYQAIFSHFHCHLPHNLSLTKQTQLPLLTANIKKCYMCIGLCETRWIEIVYPLIFDFFYPCWLPNFSCLCGFSSPNMYKMGMKKEMKIAVYICICVSYLLSYMKMM